MNETETSYSNQLDQQTENERQDAGDFPRSQQELDASRGRSMASHDKEFPSTVSPKAWRCDSINQKTEGDPQFLENALSFQVYQSAGGGTNWIIEDFKASLRDTVGVPESLVDDIASLTKELVDGLKAESLEGWKKLLEACDAGRTGKDVRNRIKVVLNVVSGKKPEALAEELEISVRQINGIACEIEACIGQSLRK